MFLAMTPDDPGVMGNLPRSRPGQRSSKRDGGAPKSAAAKPTAKKTTTRRPAKRTSKSGAKSTATTSPRARAQQKTTRPSPDRPPQPAPSGGTDPVTGAVMLAGKVVEGGLKVAGSIIKRLPRP
jgi:hypothetical protein